MAHVALYNALTVSKLIIQTERVFVLMEFVTGQDQIVNVRLKQLKQLRSSKHVKLFCLIMSANGSAVAVTTLDQTVSSSVPLVTALILVPQVVDVNVKERKGRVHGHASTRSVFLTMTKLRGSTFMRLSQKNVKLLWSAKAR